MEVSIACTVLILLVGLSAAKTDIKNCEPAAIVKQAKRTIYFQHNGDATLPCIAKGDPTLKYIWLKNGVELDITSASNREHMTLVPGVGTLILSPAKVEDAGVYQCKVQNPCGTSLSWKTKLLHAHIEPFPPVTEPEEIRTIWGKPLKLECLSPESVPEAYVSWILVSENEDYEDFQPEDEDSEMFSVELNRRVTTDYSGNLYFVAVEKEDARDGSIYVCMAQNREVRSMNQGGDKVIKLIGATPSNAGTELQWHSDKEVLALEGRKAKFKCIFSGNPYPHVSWNRVSGGQLDPERMQQSQDQHEFVITDVTAEDAGQYECTGENSLIPEPIRETFTLYVQSRPKWTTKPEDMVLGVEDNVTVVCSADANPKAQIEWYINGVPIEQAPPARNRHVQGNALVFTNLTQDDSQVIQCNASNIHGYLWIDAYLKVEAMEPTIVSLPTEQKVAKDRDIIIPCGVEGKPKPEVLWYKNSQKLIGSRYEILPSGDLRIKLVDRRDTGNYHCIAKNRFGEAEAQGALIVREKTKIIGPPDNDQVNYGESVIFICRAVTDPEEQRRLRYKWLKDGVEVDSTDPRIILSEGELKISETTSKDTGQYTCIATNDLDSDQAVATLEVRAPPDAPTLQLLSCGSLNVDLEWEFQDSQSNFSPLQEFVLEYTTNHETDVWREASRMPAETRQTTFMMSPWASYRFRMRALNQMGLGEPSKPTPQECRSERSIPFRNPSNVKTVGDKTGFLVIEWEPMPEIDHNADGFYYEVSWQAEGEDEVLTERVLDWRRNQLIVRADGVYKPYIVSVTAVNSLGPSRAPANQVLGHSGEAGWCIGAGNFTVSWSELTDVVWCGMACQHQYTIRSYSAPLAVVENFELDPNEPLTSTSASFRWDPVDPNSPEMNGKFQGYKIRYWKKDQKEDTLHEELIIIPESRRRRRASDNGDGKIRGRVSQLPSYSHVEADVVVVNTYFSSPGSNIVHFRTPEGVPSRVKYLEALFRGSSHFLLEWGVPVESNGILTGYQLGYQKVDGLSLGPIQIFRDDLLPDQHRATLDGLDPNSLYRVFVAAKTIQGAGQEYFIDVRTADDKSDLVEPRIESVSAGEHEANITFSLTEAEKGRRTGSVYFLEYRKIGEHGWDRDKEGASDHFWLTLDDLEPATSYEVRVVSVPKNAAKNSKEFKPSRETSFLTTGFVKTGTDGGNEGAKKGSFLSAAWFIGMMVAIAILLLILIVVCIVKRNRGKEYKFPPERDTVDETPALFSEPPKSAKNGVGTGAPQAHELEKVPLGEETDSLAEYGEMDPSRFNEDGSFIGQYGEGKQTSDAPPPSTMSNIV